MYNIQLEIDIQATDSNRLLGRHWTVKNRLGKLIKSQINTLSLGKKPLKPLSNFSIAVTRYSPKYMDIDNFTLSLKAAFDGLKLAKVIQDDKWEMLNMSNLKLDQIKSKDKKLLIIVSET
jgi:hypothetical protein